MTMNVKFRWSYALYLVFILSVFLLNVFVFEHSNLLKLSINTLFAVVIRLFVYPMNISNGSWLGFAKGIMIFSVTYLLFWHLLGELSTIEEKRIVTLIGASIVGFRPPNNSWQSALKMVGFLFGLSGIYYLFDTIWHRIF